MGEERSWLVELKWWISGCAALIAVLAGFALIKAVLSLATINAADLAASGITDVYGDALGKSTSWPIAAIFAFYPFLFAAGLGFRLLVPTFAGVKPRTVAVVVMIWPVAFGVWLISSDLAFSAFMAAMAVVWALAMPMPKTTVLTDQPVRGGIIVGLALGALSPALTLILPIAWCAVRFWRGKSLEVAATAMCAAIVPALFLATQLRQVTRSPRAVEIVIEVLVLAALSLAGFARWQFSSDDDEEDEAEEGLSESEGSEAGAAEAVEAAGS
jgi:hypothetical protein